MGHDSWPMTGWQWIDSQRQPPRKWKPTTEQYRAPLRGTLGIGFIFGQKQAASSIKQQAWIRFHNFHHGMSTLHYTFKMIEAGDRAVWQVIPQLRNPNPQWVSGEGVTIIGWWHLNPLVPLRSSNGESDGVTTQFTVLILNISIWPFDNQVFVFHTLAHGRFPCTSFQAAFGR